MSVPTRLPFRKTVSPPIGNQGCCITAQAQVQWRRRGHSEHTARLCIFRNRQESRLTARMALKFIENFEAEVQLDPKAREDLEALLANPSFCKQVATETSQEHGINLEYSGLLFQPVPWSPSTQKGMPAEYEKYHDNPLYVTINVPPNFMFQAKIFKPSRLCAFYKRGV